MNNVRTPQLRVPLRITNGKAEVVEQDSEEEVMQCVETLMRTPVGSRTEEPEYGIPELAFREGAVERGDLQRAIAEWEPRADTIITEEGLEQLARKVAISNDNREAA